MVKIVVVAGGTGGHVFPAVCIAKRLVKEGYNVEFITDVRGNKYLSNTDGFHVDKQKINHKSKVGLILGIIVNFTKNIYKFIKNRPACVIGFGGYPSFAPVFVAQLMGIKTIIHEQNAVIGRANALLAYRATRILTAFENTLGILRNGRQYKRVRCVGNPTRFDDLYENATRPHNSIFTILVFGGSQGSALFADVIAPAICKLNKFEVRVFHQARDSDIDRVKGMYINAGINATVSNFFNDIGKLYQASDLVISRSGASTIFEIVGFKIPSILIPYARSVNGDQLANARAIKNGAVVIEEKDVSVENLYLIILQFIENSSMLTTMSEKLSQYKLNSNDFMTMIEGVLNH